FTVLDRGLPQRNAYDIAYRHALDIDDTGDHLAFGSTTGGLWVTVDQGDSWQTVSEHLPPVHVVRWAGQRGSGAVARMNRFLADLVVGVHFLFVLFVVLGGLLVLRWRWVAYFHFP